MRRCLKWGPGSTGSRLPDLCHKPSYVASDSVQWQELDGYHVRLSLDSFRACGADGGRALTSAMGSVTGSSSPRHCHRRAANETARVSAYPPRLSPPSPRSPFPPTTGLLVWRRSQKACKPARKVRSNTGERSWDRRLPLQPVFLCS